MSAVRHVSLLGLNDVDRDAIVQCLRQTQDRVPRYALAQKLDQADLIVADASHLPSVQRVLATQQLPVTLFVGAPAPPGALACISRPIDFEHVLRELDYLVALPIGLAAARLQVSAASRWKGEQDHRLLGQFASPAPDAPASTALLVDDSEIALRFLETRLQRWGLVIDRALNSGRAIELLSKRTYDFVFLDLDLGSSSYLDGLALCQHIKRPQNAASALSSSVFMVSAHHSETDRVRGTLAGCDGYLDKPLDDAALQRLLIRHGLRLGSQPAHVSV